MKAPKIPKLKMRKIAIHYTGESYMNIRDTEDFKSGLFDVVICPVCNNETLNNHYICPHCKWEYDGAVNDDDYSSANESTVGKYREKFRKTAGKTWRAKHRATSVF